MLGQNTPRVRAILQALLVTFLWSTSWVFIKIGLEDIPAVTFAGLRYFLAFLVLIPAFRWSKQATPLRSLSRRSWLSLAVLGLLYYTIAQGTQFLALSALPAINFSLLLNFSAIVVALLAIPMLHEYPTWLQWGGAGLFILGVIVYFYPLGIESALLIGYAIAAIHILTNSFSSVLGRGINRLGTIHPLTVTIVSMGIGSILLLATGLLFEPWPNLSWQSWAIILWLAVVNTAFAFTLWNHTLRTLSAMESSIINNTMLIQIAVLAWLFLGETLLWIQVVGLALAAVGVLLVQIRVNGRKEKVPNTANTKQGPETSDAG
jgi:drug/metabolite transporter (DMT)-like permease